MENANEIKPPKPIWVGAVGATFRVRKNGATGDYFFVYEPTRCYPDPQNKDQMKYTRSFGRKHADALREVFKKVDDFLEATNANDWVASQQARSAA